MLVVEFKDILFLFNSRRMDGRKVASKIDKEECLFPFIQFLFHLHSD